MEKNWRKLENPDQLEQVREESHQRPILIFKHSTRCSISAMAWDRLMRNWKAEDSDKLSPYYLDLIRYRELSNQIAEIFDVEHESPQVLIIKNGEATYHASHMGIDYHTIISQA